MYPQVVNVNDSLMLGDTLFFQALPRALSSDNVTGLKYYLLLLFALMLSSYLFGRKKRQLSVYLKMFLSPHKDLSYDVDTPISRFQNWFCIFSFLTSSFFVALLLQGDAQPRLNLVDFSSLLLALAVVIAFVLLKLLVNFFFSWLHLAPSYWKVMQTHVVSSLNFLSLTLLPLMMVNEVMALSLHLLFGISIALCILLLLLSLPALLMFFSAQRLSLFHSFLYLCALEIIPLMLLFKTIVLIA